MRLLKVKFLIFLKTMSTIIIHLRLVAKSRQRKIYINVYPIVHSLNLRSPLSRLYWCGNHCPSLRRTFHSSRRSGGIFGTFLLQKKD
jgi:hypothetical protein